MPNYSKIVIWNWAGRTCGAVIGIATSQPELVLPFTSHLIALAISKVITVRDLDIVYNQAMIVSTGIC